MKPKALVLWVPGTNCHEETVWALNQVGADAEVVAMHSLLTGASTLTEADIIVLAGGFSYGDHGGAGTVMGLQLTRCLRNQLQEVCEHNVPMLGICNGFQVLVAAGLLPGGEGEGVLDTNRSARFEHQWKTKVVFKEPCLWTTGLDGVPVEMPVAHAEGFPVYAGGEARVTATYDRYYPGIDTYPESPNGSSVAGICNQSGVIMGLMPHPERGGEEALQIFRNGVDAVRS